MTSIFIGGIGGIGGASLAIFAKEAGFSVSGNDIRPSIVTRTLGRCGIDCNASPDAAGTSDFVVIPRRFPPEHDIVRAAEKAYVPILRRNDLLARIPQKSIVVFGACAAPLCVRILSDVLGCGWCHGMTDDKNTPYARYAPRCAVEAEAPFEPDLRNFETLLDTQPEALICSDADDRDSRHPFFLSLTNRAIERGITVVRKDRRMRVTKVYTPNNIQSFVFRIERRGGEYELRNQRCHAVSFGPESSADAAESALAYAAFLKTFEGAQEIDIPRVYGWLSHAGGRHYHEIRMHPINIEQALDVLPATQAAPVLVIKDFSGIQGHDGEEWQRVFSRFSEVIFLPPYEGTAADGSKEYCSDPEGRLRELRDAVVLWSGGDDILDRARNMAKAE